MRNSQKRWKWQMHIIGSGVWQEKWKSWKMRNTHCRRGNMARNTENRVKWEIHTVGPGLWRENYQMRKMRNSHSKTWSMARSTEIGGKWDTNTVWPELWRNISKTWKMSNEHCKTWNIAITRKKKKRRNLHDRTWYMMRNTEKVAKWETLTVEGVIWRETLKNV
jgi:hypothetical protein